MLHYIFSTTKTDTLVGIVAPLALVPAIAAAGIAFFQIAKLSKKYG